MAQAGSANSSSAPKFPPVTGTLEQGLAKGERIGCDVASEKLIRSPDSSSERSTSINFQRKNVMNLTTE
jgi:hypothetical protein